MPVSKVYVTTEFCFKSISLSLSLSIKLNMVGICCTRKLQSSCSTSRHVDKNVTEFKGMGTDAGLSLARVNQEGHSEKCS